MTNAGTAPAMWLWFLCYCFWIAISLVSSPFWEYHSLMPAEPTNNIAAQYKNLNGIAPHCSSNTVSNNQFQIQRQLILCHIRFRGNLYKELALPEAL